MVVKTGLSAGIGALWRREWHESHSTLPGEGAVVTGIALLLPAPNQPKNDRFLTFTIEVSLPRGRRTRKI